MANANRSSNTPFPTLSEILRKASYTKTNQYFLNQTVYVDDYAFVKCRFDNCRLITYKGTFRFDHCVIDASSIIEYGAEALKIAKLFNSKTPYSNIYPDFQVKINEDGTFSLE